MILKSCAEKISRTSGAGNTEPDICPVRLLAWAWLFAGLASSLAGLCQYLGIAGSFSPWVNSSNAGEAFANLRQRNQFASLTNLALLALIYLAIREQKLADDKNRPASGLGLGAWVLFPSAALLAAGNAASSSRTGLIQFVLIFACWMWWRWSQRPVRRILWVFAFAYMLAMLLLPGLAGFDISTHGMLARLQAGDQVCGSRLTLWSNVLHLIAQKPWFGWGWGELDYAHYMSLYDGPRFCDILDNAHNLPLHLAVELGVPFALLACGGFLWWVWRQQPWRESRPERQLAWSAIAIILLHSMLEYPLWYGPFQMAFGLCVLILWRSRKAEAGSGLFTRYTLNGPGAVSVRCSIAAALAAALLYAAWDYHRISQIYLEPEARDAAYKQDTMAKIGSSVLFSDQVRFAELMLTPLTRDKAQWTFDTASALLHFSPEPRVIEKVIESAVFLGRDEDAMMQMTRYRLAFPEAYARWLPSRSLSGLGSSKAKIGPSEASF